jgi:hypothetical protein
MTLTFIYTYFQFLYPNTAGGYLADPTIAGLNLREMWANLAEHNKQIAPPSYGIKQFCHYCETADDHAATVCPKLKEGKVKCEICAEAVGKANAKYRGAKALGHHAGGCIAQYGMQTRNFPQDFMDRKPTDEELRKLSHATAVADMDTIGNIFYTRYLASEWVGRDELLDLAKRIKFEETQYPDLDEDGNEVPKAEVKVTLSLAEIADDNGPLVSTPDVSLAVRIKLDNEVEQAREGKAKAQKEAGEWKAKYEALLLQQGGQSGGG